MAAQHALCWVHDGRHYKKLRPRVAIHHKALRTFLEDYWAYYHALRAYQEAPAATERARLEVRFDTLFATVTDYDALDDRIAKTRANRTELLQVLAHPELPLHNNAAELGCRARVRRRDVSFAPDGAQRAPVACRSDHGARPGAQPRCIVGYALTPPIIARIHCTHISKDNGS